MNRATRSAAAALLALACLPVQGAGPATGAAATSPALVIRVLDTPAWECPLANVEQVLYSTAGELLRYFPGRRLPPIEVAARGGPIVLFQRGAQGQIRVKLNTGGRHWAQMVYQFAHEMTHILCDYDDKHRPTKWFEESLCETASLFVLRKMAQTWKTNPPYPNWKDYSASLDAYTAEILPRTKPPPGKTFVQWYGENSEALRGNATDRARNQIVAGMLLPLLEAEPEAWQSIEQLNKEVFPGPYTFSDYLRAWHRRCGPKQQKFVAQVAAAFAIRIEEPESPAKLKPEAPLNVP